MKLDQNGLNAAINATVLPETRMREIGFTDHLETTWYYCVRVGSGTSFNVSIPKDGGRLRIDVLDEDFGQPYDYQRILKSHPNLAFAQEVKARVESQMATLSEAGVITGYTRGMYI
jgi:hypothetical protein